jgi:hypothetical protein
MVMWGLAGLVVGVTGGLLLFGWPWNASKLEAAGVWFAGLVAAALVVLAVVAYRSEDFARRLVQVRPNQEEWAKLQQEADQVQCIVRRSNQFEPGIVVSRLVDVRVENHSNYLVTNVLCSVPRIGAYRIKLADALPPGEVGFQPVRGDTLFRVSADSHELYESATFTFTLGNVEWLGRYAQPAERLDR